MGDVDRLVERAREIVALAVRDLRAGADVTNVERRVALAIDVLEDLETYAVLAAAGDRGARNAMHRLLRRLEGLAESNQAE